MKNDKLREVKNGHDGTWVAHPALVEVALNVFDEFMPQANQIDNKREDVVTTAEALLELPKGTVTEHGIRENINVGILYIESWLAGRGAAALYNLMEDAATAEISRTQVWQWLHQQIKLEDGSRYSLSVTYLEYELNIVTFDDVEIYGNGNGKSNAELYDETKGKILHQMGYVKISELSSYFPNFNITYTENEIKLLVNNNYLFLTKHSAKLTLCFF